MHESVLVANRAEIASRIIHTVRALGLKAIAVYSEADAGLPFVAEADEAILIGPGPPESSYLDIPRILEAAQRTNARAVHPGYGFLAEDAAFARRVRAAGPAWIGPPPEAIELIGDKAGARALMAEAGVPVEPDVAVAERFGEGARHVGVQILGLADGTVLALGERDRSVRRRHQKVVEESPSTGASAGLRARMMDAAVRAGEAVGHRGAGTVEFLVDPAAQDFFFLHMSTRLQAGHRVTEQVTGIDLVEQQLRVAAGEPPSFAEVIPRGHAIEMRVYAEAPRPRGRSRSGRSRSAPASASTRATPRATPSRPTTTRCWRSCACMPTTVPPRSPGQGRPWRRSGSRALAPTCRSSPNCSTIPSSRTACTTPASWAACVPP